MPEARKLQAWLTIRGPNGGALVQDHDGWLDLREYQDLVIWHEVSDQSNVSSLDIETSPVPDETMFVSVASLAIAVTSGPSITPVLLASATVPLARYLRWKVTGRIGSAFSLTFRAWVVASRPHYPPLLVTLTDAAGTAGEDPELAWLVEGGDEVLLDAVTRRNLSILEELYGCGDAVVLAVRAEARRQAIMTREERNRGERSGACAFPPPARLAKRGLEGVEEQPSSDKHEHVPVD